MKTGPEFEGVVYSYWAKRFDCDRDHFTLPGTLMILEENLEETKRTIIFHIDKMSIVRTAPSLAEEAGLAGGYQRDFGSLTANSLQNRIGDKYQIELSSTFLDCYLDPKDYKSFKPGPEFKTRRLDPERDAAYLDDLFGACTAEDLDQADIILNEPDPVIFGIFTGSQLAAYASHRYWDDVIADIGVLVHPGYRSQSLGKAVVSSLCSWCFENDIVPMYRVFDTHQISVKLSREIGFKEMVVIKSLLTH